MLDDFLIAGNLKSETYISREKALQQAFRWGKWQETEFEFAGCEVKQNDDKSIGAREVLQSMARGDQHRQDPGEEIRPDSK